MTPTIQNRSRRRIELAEIRLDAKLLLPVKLGKVTGKTLTTKTAIPAITRRKTFGSYQRASIGVGNNPRLEVIVSSWKTTISGVLTAIVAVSSAVISTLNGTPVDWTAVIAAVTASIGLLFARDSNR